MKPPSDYLHYVAIGNPGHTSLVCLPKFPSSIYTRTIQTNKVKGESDITELGCMVTVFELFSGISEAPLVIMWSGNHAGHTFTNALVTTANSVAFNSLYTCTSSSHLVQILSDIIPYIPISIKQPPLR